MWQKRGNLMIKSYLIEQLRLRCKNVIKLSRLRIHRDRYLIHVLLISNTLITLSKILLFIEGGLVEFV